MHIYPMWWAFYFSSVWNGILPRAYTSLWEPYSRGRKGTEIQRVDPKNIRVFCIGTYKWRINDVYMTHKWLWNDILKIRKNQILKTDGRFFPRKKIHFIFYEILCSVVFFYVHWTMSTTAVWNGPLKFAKSRRISYHNHLWSSTTAGTTLLSIHLLHKLLSEEYYQHDARQYSRKSKALHLHHFRYLPFHRCEDTER